MVKEWIFGGASQSGFVMYADVIVLMLLKKDIATFGKLDWSNSSLEILLEKPVYIIETQLHLLRIVMEY